MGAGLSFLNKKPWHPGSLNNLERVAKREMEVCIEEKKIEDRTKERNIEREELLRSFGTSGATPTSQRNSSLDWMYYGGITSRSIPGKKDLCEAPNSLKVQSVSAMEQSEHNRTCIPTEPAQISENEICRRMSYDPLVSIMQKEFSQRKAIRANATVMHELRMNLMKNSRRTSSNVVEKNKQIERKQIEQRRRPLITGMKKLRTFISPHQQELPKPNRLLSSEPTPNEQNGSDDLGSLISHQTNYAPSSAKLYLNTKQLTRQKHNSTIHTIKKRLDEMTTDAYIYERNRGGQIFTSKKRNM